MNDCISLLTLNVSGLQNKRKREKLFFWLKSKKDNIIFIQETHCGSEDDKKKWSEEWGGQSYWTTCSKDSVGVAILISDKIKYDIQNVQCDEKGRWVNAEIHINNS